MTDTVIRTREDLAGMIREVGFLPFFANPVRGWSAEEHTDPAVWFTDQPGPWEWKGQLASDRVCVYGKFFRNRAAFVSPEWFADLANFRRSGYDWEGWTEDGLAPYKDRLLMRYLEAHPGVQSRHAKRECGFSKGYDTVVTRLQMQTFIVLSDFEYSVTREGVPDGWGNAVIDRADRWLDPALRSVPEGRTPEESLGRIVSRLRTVIPEADEALLRRLLA